MLIRYNIRWGIVFSLAIAVLVSIPPLIRQNIGQFLSVLLLLFLRFFLCWLIHHYFLLQDFRKGFRRPSGLRTFASIILGTVVVFLITQCSRVAVYPLPEHRAGTDHIMVTNLFRALVISALTYFVVYYLLANIHLQHSRLENEYLKQDQLKAQLFSLQQQLSPHFLFNSLSTLRTIAPDNQTKTYVTQLSNVYRYLLTFHDSHRITVEAELAFTKSYLYILQERFEDALQVSIGIGERFLGYYLPPLTLQILIENALKHNVVSVDQPLRLRIYTKDAATLTIENSYQPKASIEESNGRGLQNIKDRYRLLAGKEIDVRQEEGVFVVTLPLLV
jgi:two-component system, LytTR family, sensor kinase